MNERIWCRSFPTRVEIMMLLQEMQKAGLSESSYALVQKLATYPPALRLSMNLKTFLGEAVLRPIENVLTDGLSPTEKKVLGELDTRLSLPAREVAHGLFNIHERWMLKRTLSKKFDEAHDAYMKRFDPKPLDSVLGDELGD